MTRNLLLFIFFVYLLGNISHAVFLQKTVYGDGVYYFSWLRSLSIEHNINFENEYNQLGGNQPYVSDGVPANKYSIGPALLWGPSYISIHRFIRGDGYSFPYQLTVSIASVCAALFGLILLTRLTRKKSHAGIIALLLLAFATNLFFYGSVDTVNSHAVTFFYASIFVVLLRVKPIPWMAAGIVLGALSATRLQDLLYILLVLPYVKTMNKQSFISGLCIAFFPQIIAWYMLYGSLVNPYLLGGEGFNLFSPQILGVLFGKENGLFLWTPVVVLGLIGLFMKRKTYFLPLYIILLQIYLVSTWSTWWQGASYSGRMFVSILPLIYLGLVEEVAAFSRIVKSQQTIFILALSFGAINTILILSFLLVH